MNNTFCRILLVFGTILVGLASHAWANSSVEYAYDNYGNCTAITTKSSGGQVLEETTYAYDSYRRCTVMNESAHTTQNRQWDWVYDRYIDGIGLRDASTHTANDWRVQITPAFNAAGERPMTARWHDMNGHVVNEQTGWIQPSNQPIGQWYTGPDIETHYFAYDENGQKNSYIDPRGRQTTYEYDLRNRLWKTNETVNTVPRTTETLYDPTNNKTMVKFPAEGGVQRTQQWQNYDAFGQAWTFIDERNATGQS